MKNIFIFVALAAFLECVFAANDSEGGCILPPFPTNGKYEVDGVENQDPGKILEYVALKYSCDRGYTITGSKERQCVQGVWTDNAPTCVLTEISLSMESSGPTGACLLPPYPVNGQYQVNGVENPSPGQAFDYVALHYSCARGFRIVGSQERLCVQGVWTEQDPKCVQTETHLSKESNGSKGACILPPHPPNGHYKIDGLADLSPGQAFDYVALSYTCSHGYVIFGSSDRLCVQGVWAEVEPKCVATCKLNKHPSVFYSCTDGSNFRRECGDTETDGVTVTPICHAQYYNPGTQDTPMRCVGGKWNYIAVCEPDCGRLPPDNGNLGSPFVVPWNAVVYKKTVEIYHQFCGGTLINPNAIVSSAQCYWNNKNNAPDLITNYAVALGKLYREWDNIKDKNAQKSGVADIKLIPAFNGATSKYQDDIAVLLLAANIIYTQTIWPVCIQFASKEEQLQESRLGMIASWVDGSASRGKNEASSKLRVSYLPFVPQKECLTQANPSIISSDTFCAGTENGTALCRNNNGGGIAFPADVEGMVRYFIHGIVSLRTTNPGGCSTSWLHTFTQISRYNQFIRNSVAL